MRSASLREKNSGLNAQRTKKTFLLVRMPSPCFYSDSGNPFLRKSARKDRIGRQIRGRNYPWNKTQTAALHHFSYVYWNIRLMSDFWSIHGSSEWNGEYILPSCLISRVHAHIGRLNCKTSVLRVCVYVDMLAKCEVCVLMSVRAASAWPRCNVASNKIKCGIKLEVCGMWLAWPPSMPPPVSIDRLLYVDPVMFDVALKLFKLFQ